MHTSEGDDVEGDGHHRAQVQPVPGAPRSRCRSLHRLRRNYLPGYLGIEIVSIDPTGIRCRTPVRTELLAPNGYLHAGTVVTIADTVCGYSTVVNLPEGAASFTTVELKSNFFGTAREGVVLAEATPVHLGRSTQVWDATVTDEDSGRRIALFRCTQMILWN